MNSFDTFSGSLHVLIIETADTIRWIVIALKTLLAVKTPDPRRLSETSN